MCQLRKYYEDNNRWIANSHHLDGGNEEQVQGILDIIAPVQPGNENEDVNIN